MLGHRGLAAKGLKGRCMVSDGSPLATVNDALEGFQIGSNYRIIV